jgi:hypothetical protein
MTTMSLTAQAGHNEMTQESNVPREVTKFVSTPKLYLFLDAVLN